MDMVAIFIIYIEALLGCNRHFLVQRGSNNRWVAATALGLLVTINLFNYIDRQVLAAVEPNIRAALFPLSDVNAMAKTGALGTAFLVTYMLAAPVLGWLAD